MSLPKYERANLRMRLPVYALENGQGGPITRRLVGQDSLRQVAQFVRSRRLPLQIVQCYDL